jgi:RimJ/RimL family protein N-acetyltransferase
MPKFTIKKFTVDEYDFYKEIYSDKSLMTYVNTTLTEEKINYSFNYIINIMSEKPPELTLYYIELDDLKEKIGILVLSKNQDNNNSVEIGIILKQQYHGTGLAHSAKRRLIRHAFEDLHMKTVTAECFHNNIAANNANKKLGFTQLRKYYDEGDSIDKIVWEITPNSFK